MNDIKDLLKILIEEQKKTNSLIECFISDARSAQKRALEINERQKNQVFDMVAKTNPKVGEMLKGFMNGN